MRPARLTPQESAVLTLWDRGVAMPQIACRLQLKADRVERIVTYFDGASEDRVARRRIADGSARLAKAIHNARSS